MNKKIKDIFMIIFVFLVSFIMEVLLTVSINQWNATYIPVDGLSENYKDVVLNNAEDYDINSLIFSWIQNLILFVFKSIPIKDILLYIQKICH